MAAGASWLIAQFPAPLKGAGAAVTVFSGRGELRDKPQRTRTERNMARVLTEDAAP